jgi:hypothetical protein
MRFISNSEVASWLQCRKKYYYEYVLDLEPKKSSDAINKGVLIHAVLEGYYAGKSLGYSEEECRDQAMEPIMIAAQAEFSDMVELGGVRSLCWAYFDHYMDTDTRYRVHAVETKMKSDLSDDFALVGTVDLVWQDSVDGKYIMVDHKSSYNFWTDEQAAISGQFVKYAFLGKDAGLDVKGVMVNQLRTRPLKNPTADSLFLRAWVKPTDIRIRNVLAQHIQASDEIIYFRQDMIPSRAVPIYDKYICSGCPFLPLCDSESNGAPIQYQIQADYKTRTGYGYNPTEMSQSA